MGCNSTIHSLGQSRFIKLEMIEIGLKAISNLMNAAKESKGILKRSNNLRKPIFYVV